MKIPRESTEAQKTVGNPKTGFWDWRDRSAVRAYYSCREPMPCLVLSTHLGGLQPSITLASGIFSASDLNEYVRAHAHTLEK